MALDYSRSELRVGYSDPGFARPLRRPKEHRRDPRLFGEEAPVLLEPLYEACLDRMEAFLAEWGVGGKKLHPNYQKKYTEILARVDATHRAHPLDPGAAVQALRSTIRASPALVDATIAALASRGGVTLTDGFVARSDWCAGADVGDHKRADDVLHSIVSAGQSPPSVDELAAVHGKDVMAVLKHLVRRGDLVPVALDRYYSTGLLAKMVDTVRGALAGDVMLTASELRGATGLTRKYLIPFLEYCDRRGITVRTGDLRKLGPAKTP